MTQKPPTSSIAQADESATDTPLLRKARGAFFTPPAVARFMTEWAVREADDRVLEPSCGDAEFLVHAVTRLRDLGVEEPVVAGVEIHADSARAATVRVTAAGGGPDIRVSDFFLVRPDPQYTVAMGNPPFIRFQDWSGDARDRSRAAAESGVELSGLASSWAAFTVHTTSFLTPGGRLALVLPAELLSVGYAGPVRRFLLERFRTVELVTFDEQVFPEAEVDVVLVLADGYGEPPSRVLVVRQAQNAADLDAELRTTRWAPVDPSAKWTPALMDGGALGIYTDVVAGDGFDVLGQWGAPKLGIVTGNNAYFALSVERAKELGLEPHELLPLSPPGSAHLRGLEYTANDATRLARTGESTLLFRPAGNPSAAAREYIAAGKDRGVNTAYKCRVRKDWWRVPLMAPADLFITCMNADTARITSNVAGVHHLNSVHGIYLVDEHEELGRELLPIASLNSVTLLGAEIVGRALGGGMLKVEPGEARVLPVPSPSLVSRLAVELRAVRSEVARYLDEGRLMDAVAVVDDVLLIGALGMTDSNVTALHRGHLALSGRRGTRSLGTQPAS